MVLEILAKHHQEWVAIANSFGASEDLVQDMYLRAHKYKGYLDSNNEPNRAFIWISMRNLFYDQIKKGHHNIELDTTYHSIPEIPCEYLRDALELVNATKKQWHHFDAMLFDLYLHTDLSMRDIERETGISLSCIFLTIKRCKERLKQQKDKIKVI
jgi:DNA-directed RNA polymerase specialized sigma24 family protein